MTPASAIRVGDWKLIHYYEDDRRELYNLTSDPGEQKDLSKSHSSDANRLYADLQQWRERVGAKTPTPNPRATRE